MKHKKEFYKQIAVTRQSFYLLAVWQNLTLTNIKLIYEIDSPQTLGHQWPFVTYSSVAKSSSPI